MKRFTIAAACLCMAAVCYPQGKEVPYSSSLYKDAEWQVTDANGDGSTWADETSSYSDIGLDGGKRYKYNSSNAADDWCVSPAITLEAGKEYKVKFWNKTNYDNENYALYAAMEATPEALAAGSVISKHEDYSNSKWTHEVVIFTPQTSGDYYFGFHAYSEKNKYYIYIGGFAVTENVFIPAAPADIVVTAGENKSVAATLTWTLPTTDDDGVEFGEGVAVESVMIYRDSELVATLTGDATSWTDTEAEGLTPGFHTYELQVTAGGKQSARVSVESPYIGPLQPMSIPWNPNIKKLTQDDFNLFFTVFNTENSESTPPNSSFPERKFWYVGSGYTDNYLYKYPQAKKKDDWMVSPPLKFEKAGKYRVVINEKSAYSNTITNTNIYFGAGYDVADYPSSTMIGTINATGTAKDYPLYFTVPEAGEYNIAVQELDLEGKSYNGAYIYSIVVEEAIEYPENITGLSATVSGEEVRLTWTNPSQSVLGNAITSLTKIEVYRGEDENPCAVLTDDEYLGGGSTVTHVDTPGVEGIVAYKVVPYLGQYVPEGDVAQLYSPWVGDDTQVLPYKCKFDDPKLFCLWSAEDLDNDDNTWTLASGYAKLKLTQTEVVQMNDALVSAPFELGKGYYEISFNGNSSVSNRTLKMGLIMADAEDPTSFASSKSVSLADTYYNQRHSAIVKLDDAGRYRICFLFDGEGVDASSKTIAMTDISLEAYPVLPLVATDLTAEIAADGAREVTLSWTNPSETNVEGLMLEEITKVVVSRKYVTGSGSFEEIAELKENLVPGELSTYVDVEVPESGVYEYRVEVYNNDGKSSKAAPRVTTKWVGHGLSIPYSPQDFKAWYIYNVNGDTDSYDDTDVTWEARWDGTARITSTKVEADDWLISPPLNIQVGKKYVITVKHQQANGAAVDFDLYAGNSTGYEDMATYVATLTTEETKNTEKEDQIFIKGVSSESEALRINRNSDENQGYVAVPAGSISLGLHAVAKCDLYVNSFNVAVTTAVDEITDEALVIMDGIGMPSDATDIRVFDLAGNLVLCAENLAEFNVSALSKGIYVLTAVSGDKSYKLKFEK